MSTPTTILNCDICGKSFKNKQGLDYHNTHYVCEKFTCTYCCRRFKSSLGLKYHMDNRICLPPEKIKVEVVAKSQYHTYTIPRNEVKLLDVMKATDGSFGEIIFESENIILKFCELSLTNPKLDQYWSCYISNRREPYLTVYDGEDNIWKLQPQIIEYQDISRWAMTKIYKYLQDNKAVIKHRSYWTKYYITQDQLSRKNHAIHKEVKQGLFCIFANQKKLLSEKSRVTGINIKP